MGFKTCPEGHIMDSSWKYCPVCLAPLAGWLVIQDEKGQSHKFFTLHEGKTVVGSGADCDIRITDCDLLRQQISIHIDAGECTVIDLSGDNSLKVNNIPTPRSAVMDGDMIDLGGTEFRIKLLDSGSR